ncbi:MAG: UDP-N-acetylmuramoyl-L-alanine--D-glutamate ligase [Leptospirales bacterium]
MEPNYKINLELDFSQVKKVLLVGAGGLTGQWYSRLLLKKGIQVYVYDRNPLVQYTENDLASAETSGFYIVTNEEFENLKILDKVDSVTLSPGVPLDQPIFLEAQERELFVFSELEYCFTFLKDKKWITVTGTDGKSTTVALLEHCAKQLDKKGIACGNFGLSFSQIAYEPEQYGQVEFLFAELSSYQLELARNLQSEVSAYLNLSEDHLDRYESLSHYGLVKWNGLRSLKKNGTGIVNTDLLSGNTSIWREKHPCKYLISCEKFLSVDCNNLVSKNFAWVQNTLYRHPNVTDVFADMRHMKIQGRHNCANVLFATEILFALFDDVEVEKFRKAIESFPGLEHRFEKVDSGDSNIYINDSKATTTQATMTALKNVNGPLFVFLGGKSKGEDYSVLIKPLLNKNAIVFLFGKNQKEIQKVFKNSSVEMKSMSETLEDAFHKAQLFQTQEKKRSVTYLLAPASTSWDQYASFEKRGEDFKRLVKEISL